MQNPFFGAFAASASLSPAPASFPSPSTPSPHTKRTTPSSSPLSPPPPNSNPFNSDPINALNRLSFSPPRSFPSLSSSSSSSSSFPADKDYSYIWLKAARENDLSRLKQLITMGFPSNTVDNDEDNALHRAAAGQHLDIAKTLLLCTNIEINHQNNNGDTPLHTVVKSNQVINKEFVCLLVECGASIQIKNKEGETVLSLIEELANKNNHYSSTLPSSFASFSTNSIAQSLPSSLLSAVLASSETVHRQLLINQAASLSSLSHSLSSLTQSHRQTIDQLNEAIKQQQSQQMELVYLRGERNKLEESKKRVLDIYQQMGEMEGKWRESLKENILREGEGEKGFSMHIDHMRGAMLYLMDALKISPPIEEKREAVRLPSSALTTHPPPPALPPSSSELVGAQFTDPITYSNNSLVPVHSATPHSSSIVVYNKNETANEHNDDIDNNSSRGNTNQKVVYHLNLGL